ncbi:hypothetical protein N431DRAFT_499329 [Stipitochalara longipes BDJ]|nr:hypothetical protein N431DRAFT_499329 [Stipitochalara longipes BDJ]
MAPNFLQTANSAAVVLCLANYILIPFDVQVMRNIVELNWINLAAYVMIEQLFLATFRRLDFRFLGYIPMVTAVAQLLMQRNQTAYLRADQTGLLLPTVVDAATNVAVLVLVINLSNPARPNLPLFEFLSLWAAFCRYAGEARMPPSEYPIKAVLFSGTWEQARLLSSFLFLRIAAGALLQAIVITVSQQSELRIGIPRSNCNLDLDEPSFDTKGETKPKPKFAANVNVALILVGAAVTLVTAAIGGVFVVLVKTRDAFAA